MNIEVVIGANYGDEGKGMFTEYLCMNRPKPLVVLSNGGCQRGHTVNNSKMGIRHVFHHFGSGTLVGAPTIISKSFLINPISFVKEYKELQHLGISPEVHRSLECIFQLPSDMFINQQLEKHRSRSNNKHGSCGWGIWETILRNQKHRLTFNDFAAMNDKQKLKCMNEQLEMQIADRIASIKDIDIDNPTLNIIRSECFCRRFIDDFHFVEAHCPSLLSNNIVDIASNTDYETIVVENAQGLLLDVNYAPKDDNGRVDIHTTPSKTGLKGAIESLSYNDKLLNVTPNYITRSYITRHGAGPFPEYTHGLLYEDKTNIPNDYQDAMRFGKMTYEHAKSLLERIQKDAHSFHCIPKLVITHLNEARCELLEENANYMSYSDDSIYFKNNMHF